MTAPDFWREPDFEVCDPVPRAITTNGSTMQPCQFCKRQPSGRSMLCSGGDGTVPCAVVIRLSADAARAAWAAGDDYRVEPTIPGVPPVPEEELEDARAAYAHSPA